MRLFILRLLFFSGLTFAFAVIAAFVPFELWDPIVVIIVFMTLRKVPKPQIAGWILSLALFLEFATNLPVGTQLLSSFVAVMTVWGIERWFSVMSRWLVILAQIVLGSAAYRVVQVLVVAAVLPKGDSFFDTLLSLADFSNIIIAIGMDAAIIYFLTFVFRTVRQILQKRFLFASP